MDRKTTIALAGALVLIVALLIAALVLFTDKIPPGAQTLTSMVWTEAQIREYVEVYHRLPNTLLEVPAVAQESGVKDEWGNGICYSHTSDGNVTLSSPGPDKALGEKGAIIRRFKVEAAAGSASRPDTVRDQGEPRE